MKKFDFIPTILLSIVTCGIYGIYVWYKMGEDNNQIARVCGIPEIKNYIIAILLGAVTCGIYSFYWMYKFMEQQVRILKAYGKPAAATDSPFLLLIIMFIPIFSWYILCENSSRGIDAASGR